MSVNEKYGIDFSEVFEVFKRIKAKPDQPVEKLFSRIRLSLSEKKEFNDFKLFFPNNSFKGILDEFDLDSKIVTDFTFLSPPEGYREFYDLLDKKGFVIHSDPLEHFDEYDELIAFIKKTIILNRIEFLLDLFNFYSVNPHPQELENVYFPLMREILKRPFSEGNTNENIVYNALDESMKEEDEGKVNDTRFKYRSILFDSLLELPQKFNNKVKSKKRTIKIFGKALINDFVFDYGKRPSYIENLPFLQSYEDYDNPFDKFDVNYFLIEYEQYFRDKLTLIKKIYGACDLHFSGKDNFLQFIHSFLDTHILLERNINVPHPKNQDFLIYDNTYILTGAFKGVEQLLSAILIYLSKNYNNTNVLENVAVEIFQNNTGFKYGTTMELLYKIDKWLPNTSMTHLFYSLIEICKILMIETGDLSIKFKDWLAIRNISFHKNVIKLRVYDERIVQINPTIDEIFSNTLSLAKDLLNLTKIIEEKITFL